MRIGYLFRGFLGDAKLDSSGNELSTPDGNATYSWSIEHECNKRKYKLIPLGPNLDAPGCEKYGDDIFSAFSQKKRISSYERMLLRGWTKLSDKKFPELDVVLIEWRWPIPGRNTPDDRGSIGFQNDLERQTEVISHYSDKGVPIIIWDLDHKLTDADVEELKKKATVSVIETSTTAAERGRISIEPPTVTSDLLQHDIDDRPLEKNIGYIGSRYERDETIDEWIKPITPVNTHRAKFWGKWEPDQEVRTRWPGVAFAGRIGVSSFYSAYSKVAVVPLLAKKSYYETGFITPRPWEAVLFGSIPVGLICHKDIGRYTDFVAKDANDLLEISKMLKMISPLRRKIFREEAAHKLVKMDVGNFVNTIEDIVGKKGRD